eukprot:TRINITY_DN11933_c0_g1_i1.p1 TRINITY_DN11933_c0_g1~~TRINITY_DN11933_c0_g1_i1.p1  ORF type:complete len:81 (-),score=9.44 TRINITY_DN11933_c0_g1_i1:16-258(-)
MKFVVFQTQLQADEFCDINNEVMCVWPGKSQLRSPPRTLDTSESQKVKNSRKSQTLSIRSTPCPQQCGVGGYLSIAPSIP